MAERYSYEITDPRETGFAVVSCRDVVTGLIVRTPLASMDRSFPGFVAYVGARFSRDLSGLVEIMKVVERGYKEDDKKKNPEKRLANIVDGLKHQSPGGMAHLTLAIENVPLITAASLFRRTTLHDGQESSTRYMSEFGDENQLPGLETVVENSGDLTLKIKQDYLELQKIALGNYKKWFPQVYDAYKNHFKIDENDKDQKSALTARVCDTVRGFLLSGFKTSMVYVTNATTMQQMLGDFGAGRLPTEQQLSQTILALLAPTNKPDGYNPEIKSLLNHVEPNRRTLEEQLELEKYLSVQGGFGELLKKKRVFNGLVNNTVDLISENIPNSDQIIIQHILVIHPSLKYEDVLEYVGKLNDKQRYEIGKIIFSRRDRFNLPAIASAGGVIGVNADIDLGIERDLGRHRAWERISMIHETYLGMDEIGETGFTQVAYLRQIPEFNYLQKGMEKDMNVYYEKRREFLGKLTEISGKKNADQVGMYLLPLAHQVKMIMLGDSRNLIHLEDIRIREGAHIDCRLVVAEINRQVSRRDGLFNSLQYPTDRVLVADRDQFISRN